MIIVAIVIKVHPRETDFVLENHSAVDLTPWKYGKIVAAISLIVMVIAYIIFSPIGVAAKGFGTYTVM